MKPDLILMAGPCAVESYDQIMRIAEEVKKCGAQYLRGGAYKPRSRGGTWEGLKEEGLELLLKAKREFELKVVTEILSETSFCKPRFHQVLYLSKSFPGADKSHKGHLLRLCRYRFQCLNHRPLKPSGSRCSHNPVCRI